MSKLEDIKEYMKEFLGKPFILYLTPYANNFELVIIDSAEVFVHFHGRNKIIDSTLHIMSEEVAKKSIEIYSSLNDPTLPPTVKRYDFEYITHKDTGVILEDITQMFKAHDAGIDDELDFTDMGSEPALKS